MTRILTENATLVARHDLDPTLSVFRVRPDRIPPPDHTWFEPGQYVTLGMSAREGPEEHAVQRAYSIASDPADRDALEFYIRLALRPQTDRPLTYLVWPLAVGARLHVGPRIVGAFTLARTVGRDDGRVKVFTAAGTGLAPFVSMVRDARRSKDGERLSRWCVLHGASHPHELAYRQELESAATEWGLVYLPTVSRPAESPDWRGERGRVEDFFLPDRIDALEKRLGLESGGFNPDAVVVYVCGFRGTIAEAVRRLVARGFVPSDRRLRKLLEIPDRVRPSLFFEQYDLEPLFDPADAAGLESLRRDLRSRD